MVECSFFELTFYLSTSPLILAIYGTRIAVPRGYSADRILINIEFNVFTNTFTRSVNPT